MAHRMISTPRDLVPKKRLASTARTTQVQARWKNRHALQEGTQLLGPKNLKGSSCRRKRKKIRLELRTALKEKLNAFRTPTEHSKRQKTVTVLLNRVQVRPVKDRPPGPVTPSRRHSEHFSRSSFQIHVKKANSLPNSFVRQSARLELDPSKTLFQGVSTPSIPASFSHHTEADSARAWAPSGPMLLLQRLRLVSCVTWGSPCVARAWAPSSPMLLL
eukprot:scaffold4096_cov237-Pinguiococcus_pyrenoidosus.AAC.1